MRRLLARREIIDHLLRDAAVAVVGPPMARLAAQSRPATDDLLRPLVAELDPAARRYFVEELEDGVAALYFDGVTATVTAVQVSNLGGEGGSSRLPDTKRGLGHPPNRWPMAGSRTDLGA